MREERAIAREFFGELIRARERVQKAADRLAAAHESLGIHSAGNGPKSSDISDPTCSLAVRIAECEEKLRKATAAYNMAMSRTRCLFSVMPESPMKTVLVSYYIDAMPLYSICEREHWTSNWGYKLHVKGLEYAGAIVKKIFKDHGKNS